MKNKLSFLAAIVVSVTSLWANPSEINYQGVLTDQQGNPINGLRAMQIKLYDAPTAGTLLYSEDLGNVPVQDGVYSFNFGANGTSNALTSEIVATTNGTSSTFQKILSASSVVAGSVFVTDGTYTWSQVNGSSNENDFGVVYSASLRRISVNYFNGAPSAGIKISVSYRAPDGGISGSFEEDSRPWVEVSISGIAQTPRQKVLMVPYAMRALVADSVKTESIQTQNILQQLSNLAQRGNIGGIAMPQHFTDRTDSGINGSNSTFVEGSTATWLADTKRYSSKILTAAPTTRYGEVGAWGWSLMAKTTIKAQVSRVSGRMNLGNSNYNDAEIRLVYSDKSYHSIRRGTGDFDILNPSPNKPVEAVEYYGGTPSSQWQSAYILNFVSYPVAGQKRFVDIDLSGKGIAASSLTLVTDTLDSTRITFQVISGSWISNEFESSKEIELPPMMPISGLRIFLKYDPSSSSFSGADLQGYSLKYR